MNKKIISSLMVLSTLVLAGCVSTPSTSVTTTDSVTDPTVSITPTVPTTPSVSEDPYKDYGLDFHGVSIDNAYVASNITISGIIQSIQIGQWLTTDMDYVFGVSIANVADQSIRVEFEEDGIIEYELQTVNGATRHVLRGLKTGGTTIRIYDSNNVLLFREAINARKTVYDFDIMQEYLTSADYWQGLFGLALSSDYKLVFRTGDEDELIATYSVIDSNVDYGSIDFVVNFDTANNVQDADFSIWKFSVTVLAESDQLDPIELHVSKALDLIYLIEGGGLGLADFFAPIFLV